MEKQTSKQKYENFSSQEKKDWEEK